MLGPEEGAKGGADAERLTLAGGYWASRSDPERLDELGGGSAAREVDAVALDDGVGPV